MPEGVPNPHNLICSLRKFLYDLKQASRECHEKLVEEVICQGFKKSKDDYNLFVKKQAGLICIFVVYVDDVILSVDDI